MYAKKLTVVDILDPKKPPHKYSKASPLIYDNSCKTMVLGLSSQLTHLKPDLHHLKLGVSMSFLILQIYLSTIKSLRIDLKLLDTSGTSKRITLTTSSKKISINSLSANIPIQIPRAIWVVLNIDIPFFLAQAYPNSRFQVLNQLDIFGNCKIKRIFQSNYQIDRIKLQELGRVYSYPPGVLYSLENCKSKPVLKVSPIIKTRTQHSAPLIRKMKLPPISNTSKTSLYREVLAKVQNKLYRQGSQQQLSSTPSLTTNVTPIKRPPLLKKQVQKMGTQKVEYDKFQSHTNWYTEYEEIEEDIKIDEEIKVQESMRESFDEDSYQLKGLVYDQALRCFFSPNTNEYYNYN